MKTQSKGPRRVETKPLQDFTSQDWSRELSTLLRVTVSSPRTQTVEQLEEVEGGHALAGGRLDVCAGNAGSCMDVEHTYRL